MLAGLISVLSIAAVLTTGGTVRDAFDDAGGTLASARADQATSDFAQSGEASLPEATEDPEPPFATWTITAGIRKSGTTTFYGYRSGEYSPSFGARPSWGGSAELVGFYYFESGSSSAPTYLILRGNHVGSISPDMVVSCLNGVEVSISDTVFYSDSDDTTLVYWNPSSFSFISGREYQCKLGEPAS